MGLKQQLLDSVKNHIPQFDETKHSFSISFEGGGDSFDSFSYFETDVDDWNGMGSDTSFLDDNLLLSIIEESGVEYVWAGGTTTGQIVYINGVLSVNTEYQNDDNYDEDDEDYGWEEDSKELKE
jgi:hypothetical protein